MGGKVKLDLVSKIENGRLRVDQGVIAGCAGGTYSNICEAAQILEGHTGGNGEYALSVYPSSQPTMMAPVSYTHLITIAVNAPDKFGALLTVGFTVQVVMQAVLNMAVVTNTIPNTGISLPFFSSGGTSLMMLLGEMGIVLSVSRGES